MQTPQTPQAAQAPRATQGPLAVGSKVPDFTLKLATREGAQDWTLSQHLGKGPLVLAFFPFAFSVPCTKELCDMRDSLGAFHGLGAQVYGFSVDTPFVNTAFAKANDAAQGLLSDPNREVVPRIWATMTVAGVHNVAKRGVMVVSPDGTVKWTSISDDPKVWVGADEVRRHL
jgi:glutaredoxin-dependent peroxiredoxin